MKKIIFGLVAMTMFGFAGNAQKLTEEQVRVRLATATASLVNDCAPSYKRGMSYEDFIKNVLTGGTTGPTIPIPTEEGQLLMKTVYGYASKGTKSEEIIRTDNGQAMGNVAYFASKTKNLEEVGVKVFGEKIIKETEFGKNILSADRICCKWLGQVFEWIWDNHDEIISIICIFTPWC